MNPKPKFLIPEPCTLKPKPLFLRTPPLPYKLSASRHLYVAIMLLVANLGAQLIVVLLESFGGLHSWWGQGRVSSSQGIYMVSYGFSQNPTVTTGHNNAKNQCGAP